MHIFLGCVRPGIRASMRVFVPTLIMSAVCPSVNIYTVVRAQVRPCTRTDAHVQHWCTCRTGPASANGEPGSSSDSQKECCLPLKIRKSSPVGKHLRDMQFSNAISQKIQREKNEIEYSDEGTSLLQRGFNAVRKEVLRVLHRRIGQLIRLNDA